MGGPGPSNGMPPHMPPNIGPYPPTMAPMINTRDGPRPVMPGMIFDSPRGRMLMTPRGPVPHNPNDHPMTTVSRYRHYFEPPPDMQQPPPTVCSMHSNNNAQRFSIQKRSRNAQRVPVPPTTKPTMVVPPNTRAPPNAVDPRMSMPFHNGGSGAYGPSPYAPQFEPDTKPEFVQNGAQVESISFDLLLVFLISVSPPTANVHRRQSHARNRQQHLRKR